MFFNLRVRKAHFVKYKNFIWVNLFYFYFFELGFKSAPGSAIYSCYDDTLFSALLCASETFLCTTRPSHELSSAKKTPYIAADIIHTFYIKAYNYTIIYRKCKTQGENGQILWNFEFRPIREMERPRG